MTGKYKGNAKKRSVREIGEEFKGKMSEKFQRYVKKRSVGEMTG